MHFLALHAFIQYSSAVGFFCKTWSLNTKGWHSFTNETITERVKKRNIKMKICFWLYPSENLMRWSTQQLKRNLHFKVTIIFSFSPAEKNRRIRDKNQDVRIRVEWGNAFPQIASCKTFTEYFHRRFLT